MTKQKPATWTVGAKVEGGWTVVRVRQFFAVLKNDEKPAAWAFQTIDGKITKAKSSAEAGEKGRAYRDAQKAKGITVERAPRKPAAKKSVPAAPARTRKPRATR